MSYHVVLQNHLSEVAARLYAKHRKYLQAFQIARESASGVLPEIHNCRAASLAKLAKFNQAEEHYIAAGNFSSAIQMHLERVGVLLRWVIFSLAINAESDGRLFPSSAKTLQRDFHSALRIAEGHCFDLVDDILIAEAEHLESIGRMQVRELAALVQASNRARKL